MQFTTAISPISTETFYLRIIHFNHCQFATIAKSPTYTLHYFQREGLLKNNTVASGICIVIISETVSE